MRAVVDDTERLYGYRALTTYPLVVEAGLSRDSIIEPWQQDLLKNGFVPVFLFTHSLVSETQHINLLNSDITFAFPDHPVSH